MNKSLSFGIILTVLLLLVTASAHAMQPGLNVLFNDQSKHIVHAPQSRATDVIDAFKKNKEYYDKVLKANIPQRNPFVDETFAKATDPDAVTLELDSQRRIIIPKNVARECETIRNLIDDCETNSIPLVNQPFLTRDILKKLFLCIKDRSKCSIIPTNDLQNVLLAANFLNYQKKTHLQEVGFKTHIELSEEQLLPETKSFINSLFHTKITEGHIWTNQLTLHEENLINLDVLKNIPENTRKKIKVISAPRNYLKEIDFDTLRALFPNLQKVDFSHNLINKISGKNPLYITTADPALPPNSGFQADLSYNRLKDVPTELLTAANLSLDLQANELSSETCKKLANIKAPFLQKYGDAIKSSMTINKWDFMTMAISGLFFGLPAKSTLTQPPTLSVNYVTDRLGNMTFAALGALGIGTTILDIYRRFKHFVPNTIKKNPLINVNNQLQPQLKPITVNRNSNFMMFKPNGLRDMRSNNL